MQARQPGRNFFFEVQTFIAHIRRNDKKIDICVFCQRKFFFGSTSGHLVCHFDNREDLIWMKVHKFCRKAGKKVLELFFSPRKLFHLSFYWTRIMLL